MSNQQPGLTWGHSELYPHNHGRTGLRTTDTVSGLAVGIASVGAGPAEAGICGFTRAPLLVFQSSVIDRPSPAPFIGWGADEAEAMRRTRSSRAASSLKGIIGRYEGADGRCRHEIFRDILLLAAICAVWAHRDFSAHNPEQAFASGIEYARPRIASGRNIADYRGKPPLDILR